MSDYEIKLRAVFQWCMSCEWSVADLNMLFSRIYNIWHYRLLWLNADTPENTALAAWSRDEAYKDLSNFCHARCFPDEIRIAVFWLAEHSR